MRRIVVYGSGGAGKSTFAAALADRLDAAHVEIDLLAFDAEGVHVSQEKLRARFEVAIAVDRWVVEGMHRDQLHRALEVADTFVWLDYPKSVVARRLLGRLGRQLVLRHERHGRTTSVRSAFGRELPFVRKTLGAYDRRRQHAEALAARATALGVRVEHLASPAEAAALVTHVGRKVRAATPQDAAVVARLYVASENEGYGKGRAGPRDVTDELVGRWRADLARASHRWWVAEQDGVVVGIAGIGPVGELDTIAVDPKHWRQGIGRALLDVAESGLLAAGYHDAILWTAKDYELGYRFYEAMGWQLVAGTTRDDGRQVQFRKRLR